MIERWLTELGATTWSVALRDSHYVWPFAESLHVLTLALFAGSAALLDLRLLGAALTRVPVTALTARLLPWTRWAFVVMVATGVLLFCATPLLYYHDLFFRLKMLLVAVAGVNVFVFHARAHRTASAWAREAQLPRSARIAAIVSLVAWGGVIVSGRLIAYNWYACDKAPLPAAVVAFTGCPVADSSRR